MGKLGRGDARFRVGAGPDRPEPIDMAATAILCSIAVDVVLITEPSAHATMASVKIFSLAVKVRRIMDELRWTR